MISETTPTRRRGRPYSGGPQPRVTFRAPEELRDRLRAHGEAHGVAISDVIRRALEEHLDREAVLSR